MDERSHISPGNALVRALMKAQRTAGCASRGEGMKSFLRFVKTALPLVILSVLLFGYVLHSRGGIFLQIEAALLSLQRVLLVFMVLWCGALLFATFSLKQLPLIGFLLIAIISFLRNYSAGSESADVLILVAGVTAGKGASYFFEHNKPEPQDGSLNLGVGRFLFGVILLLLFSSCWRLATASNYYQGPRWMGLWDSPDEYGMLMGVGMALAAGLLAARSGELRSGWREWLKPSGFLRTSAGHKTVILLMAAGILGMGLLFSYSRGAWVGTSVGLLYLAMFHGKFKWRWVLPAFLVVAVMAVFFWNNTSDAGPWYVKRLDLSRASAQHRVAAWKAGFEIMRDYPLGVGWNNAVDIYEKKYASPLDGAKAIKTNDYLTMGTQLGVPALICFIAYIVLCFRNRPSARPAVPPVAGSGEGTISSPASGSLPGRHLSSEESLRIACGAGTLVLLVAFWFDGGLFKMATASVFWILLELSQVRTEGSGASKL